MRAEAQRLGVGVPVPAGRAGHHPRHGGPWCSTGLPAAPSPRRATRSMRWWCAPRVGSSALLASAGPAPAAAGGAGAISLTAPLRVTRSTHPQVGPRSWRDGRDATRSPSAAWASGCAWPAAPNSAAALDRFTRCDRHLYKVLDDWFPGAAQMAQVQRWKGARPMLPDGPPVLGASGARRRLAEPRPRLQRLGAVVPDRRGCWPTRSPAARRRSRSTVWASNAWRETVRAMSPAASNLGPQRVLPVSRRWPLQGIVASRAMEGAAAAVLPAHTLMARAGLAVARLALAVAPRARRVLVLAGPRQQRRRCPGGGALAAGPRGLSVQVALLADPARLPPDAAWALAGAPALDLQRGLPPAFEADLVLDGLLGIGLARAPDGEIAQAIRQARGLRPAPARDRPALGAQRRARHQFRRPGCARDAYAVAAQPEARAVHRRGPRPRRTGLVRRPRRGAGDERNLAARAARGPHGAARFAQGSIRRSAGAGRRSGHGRCRAAGRACGARRGRRAGLPRDARRAGPDRRRAT
jgi:NAD(P)H-hydrate repair Nnr-like enzyme with NAD(P)H-hydrate epimerase domain